MKSRIRQAEAKLGVNRPEFCPGCHHIEFVDMYDAPSDAEPPPRKPCPVHGTDFLPTDHVTRIIVCRAPERSELEGRTAGE